MKIRLYLIIIFNMIDAYCTIYLNDHGGAELNPLVVWLLQWPMVFIWTKLIISVLFAICLWKLREQKFSNLIVWLAFVPYCIIAIYYIMLFILFL